MTTAKKMPLIELIQCLIFVVLNKLFFLLFLEIKIDLSVQIKKNTHTFKRIFCLSNFLKFYFFKLISKFANCPVPTFQRHFKGVHKSKCIQNLKMLIFCLLPVIFCISLHLSMSRYNLTCKQAYVNKLQAHRKRT